MSVKERSIWIFLSVINLAINLIFPFSVWFLLFSLIPFIITGHLIILYSREFIFNTPWGIPYFIIILLNFSVVDKAFHKTALFYGLTYINALIIKLIFALTFVFVVVKKVRGIWPMGRILIIFR